MLRSELREGKIVRALPEDVEAVLETMFRTAERTKGWIRDYFVAGLSAVEIADRDGVPRQQVATVMRLFGQKLSTRISHQLCASHVVIAPFAEPGATSLGGRNWQARFQKSR